MAAERLTAWCPNCLRFGDAKGNESAKDPCPRCQHAPREACFVTPCPGGSRERCPNPVFHSPANDGEDFWVFDGWVEPGVRDCRPAHTP